MHPRFLQFIEDLRNRPHKDRQLIGMGVALALTAVLVGGRIVLFPVSIGSEARQGGTAAIGQVFSNVTEDLSKRTESIKEDIAGLSEQLQSVTDVGKGEKPASVPLVPNDSEVVPPAGDDWAVSDEGYFYEYPTGAAPPSI